MEGDDLYLFMDKGGEVHVSTALSRQTRRV